MSIEELCSRVLTVLPPGDNAEWCYGDIVAALEQLVAVVKVECGESKTEETALTSEDWAKLVVVGAGCVGAHYWTTSDSRKLAKGELSFSIQCNHLL